MSAPYLVHPAFFDYQLKYSGFGRSVWQGVDFLVVLRLANLTVANGETWPVEFPNKELKELVRLG
ncbi:hypothetical protein [Telluribacter sp.]|jgi:hypothetical protein|uniref:hypothetical protein n=1 Tax=Telluribacter sp. TaxID=1978767 RepID=UPI002E14F59F|nr:hypothetical protein [Telluribacter sp.]